MTHLIVAKETTQTARRALLVTLAGAAGFFLLAIALERMFEARNTYELERLTTIKQDVGRLALAREKMRASAVMAARTGDATWLERYSSQPQHVSEALASMVRSADPALLDDLKVLVTYIENLSGQERTMFATALAGARAEALQLLQSSDYKTRADQASHLVDRIAKSAATAIVTHKVDNQTTRWVLLSAYILCASLGTFLLWRFLVRRLDIADGAYSAAEKRMRWLSHNDATTGLSNRTSLNTALVRAMIKANADSTKLALLIIDLDRFRIINRRYGHAVGDQVLKETAERLRAALSTDIYCGRYSGDQFLAIFSYDGPDQAALQLGEHIARALSLPTHFNRDQTINLSASVGIAIYPDNAETNDDLLAKSEIALRNAKARHHGSKVALFDNQMDSTLKLRNELAAELPRAIDAGEVVPYFQPFIDLETGALKGFEVLSRWHHPTRGTVPPLHFIPLADKLGLNDSLTLSVMGMACEAMRDLPADLVLAVNIAPAQIEDETLTTRLLGALQRHDFPPHRLEVELTENALVNDVERARNVLNSLGAMGVHVALDDFGTGCSSLSYLSDLPIGKIKIDQSFIRTVHDRPQTMTVVKAIIGLGHNLGAYTVAEGIETETDAGLLRAMGCTYAQGYHYSRPVPAFELPNLVAHYYQAGANELRAAG